MIYYEETKQLIERDRWRMLHLNAVASITDQDLWIGGGFLRNAIWDFIFNKHTVRDVDVVYVSNDGVKSELLIKNKLNEIIPETKWDVTNCVRICKQDNLYVPTTIEEAVFRWPEIATCVACQLKNNKIQIIAPYGLVDCWHGIIRHNPIQPRIRLTEERVEQWKKIWSGLTYYG